MTTPLARGVDHLGITVPDVDEATRFFVEAFGAEVLYDLIVQEDGAAVVQPPDAPRGGYDRLGAIGLHPDAQIQRVRLLRLGKGPSLEIFEFTGVPQQAPATSSDLGLQHMAVYVDDIVATAAAVERAGGTLRSGPNSAPGWESGERSLFHYVRAPWGTSIELITYPNGQLHDAHGRKRWRPSSEEA